jgi:mRNA interferase HigB
MNVLTRVRFSEAKARHPNDSSGLSRLLLALEAATITQFKELQELVGSNNVDLFKPRAAAHWVVIDVGGNNLRVIGGMDYRRNFFYVKHILTHADYDKANQWYRTHAEGLMP